MNRLKKSLFNKTYLKKVQKDEIKISLINTINSFCKHMYEEKRALI